MKKKLIVILTVLIVLYLIGKGCSSNNTGPTQTTSTANSTQETPKVDTTKLPENKFDATTTIPGTNLILTYPSQGFYQLGAKITKYEPGDPNGYGNVLTIQANQTYDAEKGSEFITTAISLRNAGSEEKILKNVKGITNPNQIEADYVKENGNYQTIAGREFFIYKVNEAINMWKAITLQNNQVIIITLMYKPTDGQESEAAYKNNDALFLEILKNISSK